MRRNSYKCTSDTKEKLLSATIKLVKEKGVKNTTIRDICKNSGVSNGAFYHYYNSKEELLKDTYYQIDKLVTPDFIKSCNDMEIMHGLYEILKIYVLFIVNEAGILVKEYHKVLLDGVNISVFDPKRPYYQAIKEQLNRCIDEGVISSGYTLEYLTNYCIRFLRGLIFDWGIHDGDYNLLEQFEMDFKTIMAGVLINEY